LGTFCGLWIERRYHIRFFWIKFLKILVKDGAGIRWRGRGCAEERWELVCREPTEVSMQSTEDERGS